MSINKKGLEAALLYLKTNIAPVEEELKGEIRTTAINSLSVFFVIVTLFCIILLLFVSYENNISALTILISIVLLLAFVIFVFVISATYMEENTGKYLTSIISSLPTSQESIDTILLILNGAASKYMNAINEPC
jgi:Ca2+/Na+ antiporter